MPHQLMRLMGTSQLYAMLISQQTVSTAGPVRALQREKTGLTLISGFRGLRSVVRLGRQIGPRTSFLTGQTDGH